MRGSHSGDSSRIAFYWDNKTNYKIVSQTDGVMKIQFAKRAKPDLAYIHITPPANLAAQMESLRTELGAVSDQFGRGLADLVNRHDEIRRRLDQYGVFDKQLFPDLDGIAKWLKYRAFEINGTI